jgi:putative endonuclease
MTNTKTGVRGEHFACRFLESKGMRIITRNWRYGKGEIDIIAQDKDTLVFIEVKYRKSLAFGLPEEAMTRAKQIMLRQTIAGYLLQHKVPRFRVDVVAIVDMQGKASLRHLKDILLLQ